MKNGHVLFQTRKGFRVYGGALLLSLLLALPAAATTVEVKTFAELKAAIQNASVDSIVVAADINVPCAPADAAMTTTAALSVERNLTIKGKDNHPYVLKRTGDSSLNNRSILEIYGNGTYDGITVSLAHLVFDGGAVWKATSTPQTRWEGKWNGGSYRGKSTQNDGISGRGVIDVANKGTLNLEDGCVVQNGDCTCNTLTRQTLGSDGSTNTYGGGIRVNSVDKARWGGTVNVKSGSVVQDCSGSGYGGGIGAYDCARLNVYGGTVRRCSASHGGGIGVTWASSTGDRSYSGVIALSGALISDCYAGTGAALLIEGDGTKTTTDTYYQYSRVIGLTASNCTADKGPAIALTEQGKMYLASSPAVKAIDCTGIGNLTSCGYSAADGIYKEGGTTIWELTNVHAVNFVVDGQPYGKINVENGRSCGPMFPADPTDPHKAFQCWKDGDGNVVTKDTVVTSDLTLTAYWYDHSHCLCGDGACTAAGHVHEVIGWKEWTSTTTLPTTAGNWYLANDVTLSAACTPASGVNLCLNGHDVRISGTDNFVYLKANVAFAVTDCGTTVRYATDPNGDGAYETIVTSEPASGACFLITGGAFVGGSNNTGGTIYVRESGSAFALYRGNIVGHNCTHIGGAVGVMNGTFNMYGGLIGGCRAANRNMAVHDWYGYVNVYGGTFCNNNCAIFSENSNIKVYGGLFTRHTGTVFSAWGNVNLYGGDITGNTTPGATLNVGVAVLQDCFVTNNTMTGAGAAAVANPATIGGGLVVKGNVNTADSCERNLYLASGKTTTIAKALASGAQIGVTTATAPTSTTKVEVTGANGADYAKCFTSDNKGYVVVNDANTVKLALPGVLLYCGSGSGGGSWMNGFLTNLKNFLPTISAYTFSQNLSVFNDNSLLSKYQLIFVAAPDDMGVNLSTYVGNLKCYAEGGGCLAFIGENTGCCLAADQQITKIFKEMGLDMWYTGKDVAPAGVDVSLSVNTTADLCSVEGYPVKALNARWVPEFALGVGTALKAQTVASYNNKPVIVDIAQGNGYITSFCDVNLWCGGNAFGFTQDAKNLTGNLLRRSLANIRKIQSMYTLTYEGMEGASYGLDDEGNPIMNPTRYDEATGEIVLNNPVKSHQVFTGWSGTGLEGDTNLNVVVAAGSAGNRTYTAHWKLVKHCLCGDGACTAAGHTHEEVEWKPWTSTDSLPTTADSWYLVNDVTLTAEQTIGANVNLCLNGRVVKAASGKRIATISSGATFQLTDCEQTVHNFSVGSDGLWTLTSSAKTTDYEDLTARPAANAVVAVKGGALTGGSSAFGGGVYCNEGGRFTLACGNIVGNLNNSTSGGGGLHLSGNTSFTMLGGRVIGNVTSSFGGGIYSLQTHDNPKPISVNISGGEISFNTTTGASGTGNGGGIVVEDYCTAVITGDVRICHNKAKNNSGAIRLKGKLTMLGGEISGNESGDKGGAIYYSAAETFSQLIIGGSTVIAGNKKGMAENNVCLDPGVTIAVSTETPLAAGAQIGVTTATKPSTTTALVPVTSNRGEDLAYFTSDEGHLVVNEAGKVQFKFVLNVAFYANHADVTRDGAAFSSTNAVLNYGSTDGIPTLACGDLIFAGWTKTVGGTTPDYRTAEEVSTMSTVSGSFQLYAVWADKLVLGEFAPLTQTFPDAVATADPELTYKQVTLMFTREMTGETFVLPTGAQYSNYVKNTSLSTDYSCVIDLTTAQTAAEIATNYLRQVKFRGCVNQELRVVLGPKTSYKTFYNIDTQHYYQYVPFDWMYNPKTWIESYNLAKGMTYAGRKGYLATVTSLKEDSFIYNAANEVGWLGGTHMKPTTLNGQYYDGFTPSQSLSYWYWACGPECGDEFFDAKNLKDTSYAGNAAKGYYFNWDNGEPNGGVDNNKENCLTTLRKGAGYSTGSTISKYSWNDSEYNRHDGTGPYGPDYMPRGFFVEYGDKKIGDTSEPEEGEVVSGVRGYAIAVADIVAPYVAFNAWGGYHGDDPSCEVTSNVCVDGVYTLPRFAPTRTGYDFSGWFASWTNGAAQAIKDEEMFVQGPHTVYAQWISKSVPQGEGAKTFEYETTGDGTGALLKGATNKLETTDLAIPEFVDNGTGGSIPYVIIQKDAFAYDNYDKKRERDLQEAGVSEAESVTNDLTSVTVSTYVTNIQSYAFYSCAQLTNVTFSKTRDYKTGEKAVLHVRDWAFEGSGVKSVTFPADSKVVLDYGCFAEAEYLRDITFLGDVELKARYPFVGSGTRIFNADGSRAKVTLHLSAKLASDPAFVASLTNGMSNVRVDLSQKIEGGDRTGSVVIKSGPTVSGGNVTFAFTVSEESNWLKVTEDTVYLFWSTTLTDAKTFIGNEPLKPTTLSGPDANGVYTATFVKPATPESTAAYFQLAIGDAR